MSVEDQEQKLRNVTARDYIETARAFGAEFAETAAERERNRVLPFAELGKLRDAGLLSIRLPAPYGPGLRFSDYIAIQIEIARGDSNVAQPVVSHASFVERLIMLANPTDQARYFPMIARGAQFSSISSERGGKNGSHQSTRLTANGRGGYTLSGRKDYCTGSAYAQYLSVGCLREDGTKMFVVVPKDRAGITVVDDWDGFGQRLTSSGTVLLDQVAVAPDEVVVGSEIVGRNYLGTAAQITHAALDAGIALAALDDAIRYARTRARPVAEAGVERASEDVYVIHAIGELAAKARAAVALTQQAALAVDEVIEAHSRGEADDDLLAATSVRVAEAKVITNDTCLQAGEMLFRVGGATGTLRSLNLDRHWRNARTHTLHDPASWKFHAIGNYLLNGIKPPATSKY